MQKPKHEIFMVSLAVISGIFWRPLWMLTTLSIHRDEYSHIVLIPLISMVLIYWRRTKIFSQSVFPNYTGVISTFGGFALYGAAIHFGRSSTQAGPSWLFLSILGLVVACVGVFLFAYGWSALRASLFPVGFLLFAVPLPAIVLTTIVSWLQQGSADIAALLLRTVGVPLLRDGLIFQLPGISIAVAPECSGIRSSIALLITTLLASQFFLRSNWRKLALCLLVFPLALVKNGLRIATLSILSVYVSRDFLFGWLHRSGGFVFFMIGLTFIFAALWTLRLSERHLTRDEAALVVRRRWGSETGKLPSAS